MGPKGTKVFLVAGRGQKRCAHNSAAVDANVEVRNLENLCNPTRCQNTTRASPVLLHSAWPPMALLSRTVNISQTARGYNKTMMFTEGKRFSVTTLIDLQLKMLESTMLILVLSSHILSADRPTYCSSSSGHRPDCVADEALINNGIANT